MISASVVSPQITASVSGNNISASVSGGNVSASVSGGVGPSGVTTITGASDVESNSLSDGDVLRYSGSKWRNYPERNLVDGGNW